MINKRQLLVLFVSIIFGPFYVLSQSIDFKVYSDSLKVYNAFTFSPNGKKLYTSELAKLEDDNGVLYIPRWGKRSRPWVSMYEYDVYEDSIANRKQLSFANDSLDYAPHINFSGSRIYFTSRRPIPGRDTVDERASHVWYSERLENNEWSSAIYFSEINSPDHYTSYAQELRDGSVVYQSDIPGGMLAEDSSATNDLWISEFRNKVYQPPINLAILNSSIHEDQFVINKNENLIIFTRFDDKEMYAFYAIKEKDQWGEPKELALTDLPGFKEQSPRLSPDNKTFFFAHGQLVMYKPLELVLPTDVIDQLR